MRLDAIEPLSIGETSVMIVTRACYPDFARFPGLRWMNPLQA